jgi:hypothetical protein
VDCTFHYLTKYQQSMKLGKTSIESSCDALAHTGKPLMESTVVSSIGMLALCLSSFTPTSRFGWIMASMMTTSLLGELILLPALLSLRPAPKADHKQATSYSKALAAAAAARIDPPGRIEPAHIAPAGKPHVPGAKTGVARTRRGLDI